MSAIKIIAAAKQEHSARLRSLLDNEQLQIAAMLEPEAKSLDRAGSTPADALILYSNSLDYAESEFLERIYMTRRQLVTLLICETCDADMMARAINCGVHRILSTEDGEDKVCEAVIAAVAREHNRQNITGSVLYESRVISVFGTKGGTGKTTVAVNLAVALARMGKKAAILDLDLQFGDVSVFLDLTKTDSITDIINENDFKSAALKSYLSVHRSGVYALCAPPSPEYAEIVMPEHIEKIVSNLRSEFDCLVLDLPPSFSDCSLQALDLSDSVLYVVTPDISALRNARICMNTLRSISAADKVQVVINKEGYSQISKKDVESTLNMKPVMTLPYDIKTSMTAVNRGVPFVLSAAGTKISKAISAYAKEVCKA